jgi:hypothetical protein
LDDGRLTDSLGRVVDFKVGIFWSWVYSISVLF